MNKETPAAATHRNGDENVDHEDKAEVPLPVHEFRRRLEEVDMDDEDDDDEDRDSTYEPEGSDDEQL